MSNLTAPTWDDYEIIDSGKKRKLERFGSVTLIRPDRGAYWNPSHSSDEWKEMACGEFIETKPGQGEWKVYSEIPEQWPLSYRLGDVDMVFLLKPTQFKHVGVFPEQTVNWNYLFQSCGPGDRVLNLFAHTGGASMAAALSGADVTHVDSVYSMVGWARQNSEEAKIDNIRWICEDGVTFVAKEKKRGRTYDRIIMDPPTYGFSKKGRQWKIERDLEPLLANAVSLLSAGGEIILNCYSIRMEENRLRPLLNRVLSQQGYSMDKLFLRDKQGHELFCGYLVRAVLT